MEIKEGDNLCWTKLHNGIRISTMYRRCSSPLINMLYFETMVFGVKENGKDEILDQDEATSIDVALANQMRLTKKYSGELLTKQTNKQN